MTTTPRPYTVTFTRRGDRYVAVVTHTATGRSAHLFRVYRTETANASARGGATRPEWIAEHGGRKFHAATRGAAVDAVIAERFPSFLR